MSQDTEQYRAVFEAWFKSANEYQWSRAFDRVDGDYRYVSMETEWAFRGYVAGKSEASTEPSTPAESDEDALYHADCAAAAIASRIAGGGAGALTDDAKDAARWQYARSADWDDIRALFWAPQIQNAGTPEECMAALDKAIDAEIAAIETKAGSGT